MLSFCSSLFNDGLSKKTLTLSQSYREGTLIEFYVQRFLRACRELFTKSPFTDFRKAMAFQMLFHYSTFQLHVLATLFEGFSLRSPQKTPVHVGGLCKPDKRVHTAAFDRSTKTDDVQRYVMYLMFDRPNLLVLKCDLYAEGAEWSEVSDDVTKRGHLPKVSENSPDHVVAVLVITRTLPPTPNFIVQDKNRMSVNQVSRKVPPVFIVYVNHSVLHSGAKQWSAERSTDTRTSKPSWSLNVSPMIKGAVLNRLRMANYMIRATRPVL